MATFILQNKASIVDSDIIIVHVGTNEINRTSVAHYKAGYCNLICLLKREFSHSRIAISAIIPRPVDHDKTGQKIVTINSELSKLCERQHVDYIRSFKYLVERGRPRTELYAVKDGGLHLNLEGSRLLGLYFKKRIQHMHP